MAHNKKDPEKGRSIDTAYKNLKNFMKIASEVSDPEFISTGHFYLDLAIAHGVSPDETEFDISKYDLKNFGGFPLGKLVELSGPEGSGKSSLAYRIVGNAQKKDLNCLWIDAEFSFSKKLATLNGVDLSRLNLATLVDTDDPEHLYSAEEIFDRICDACQAGIKVIVLDSVANLTTKAELENYLTDGGVGMGALAQILSKALKKIVNYAEKYGTMVILINQMREKIGVLFGNPETTPGGRALKHLESVRIQMKPQFGEKGEIKETDDDGNEKIIGGNRYVYILKNRFGAPVKGSIIIPVYYQHYFPDVEQILFNEGRKLKVITKYKSEFRWNEMKAEGKAAFIAALTSEDAVEQLVTEIKKKAEEEKVILPPEVSQYTGPAKKDDVKNDETKVSRRRKAKDTVSEPAEPVES